MKLVVIVFLSLLNKRDFSISILKKKLFVVVVVVVVVVIVMVVISLLNKSDFSISIFLKVVVPLILFHPTQAALLQLLSQSISHPPLTQNNSDTTA